jgi:hypothetical protein
MPRISKPAERQHVRAGAHMGCTIGQGLSGISTLSLGSALALFGIVAGALAAFRYQSWRLDRMA